MESLPVEQNQPPPGTTWSRSRDAAAPDPVLERQFTNPAVRAQLLLQQGASAILRRRLTRALARVVILLGADLGALAAARVLVRAIRDYQIVGAAAATLAGTLIPQGILGGVQYAAALLLALLVTGNYGRGDQRHSAQRLFLAVALATALPLWSVAWAHGAGPILVLRYVATTLLIWGVVTLERSTLNRVVAWALPAGRRAPALFVGGVDHCEEGARRAVFRPGGDYVVIGFVDVRSPPSARALGYVADFVEILHRTGAETVVVCGYLNDATFNNVVDASLAAGAQILSVQRAIEMAGVMPRIVWRYGEPLVELTAPTLKGRRLFVKRLIDVVGSLAGLVLFGLPALAVALAIRLDSPGPVLFSQERVGLGGRRFRILKFRTMRDGADAERDGLAHLNHSGDIRLFKIPNDPRVTPFGAWLRKTSLDELPQLWNVLVGEMSLVGPRPFFESDLQTYEDHHFRRLGAKPGITGLWQVKGRSAVTDFEEVVRLDREYIERWSLALDFRILLLTLPAVLHRSGAF